METSEFINNFADQFDETDVSVFTLETRFRELEEWDSMLALSIMAMVDEKYQVKLSPNEMKLANTIQDLYDLVKSKK